jgi:DNA polymerase-1
MTDSRPLLLLIDGHALAFRAFHALAEQGLRASSGEPTYAIFGFTSIMLSTFQEQHPTYVAVAFDLGRTFRDDLYAEYKANRGEPPSEFEQQLERIKQVVTSLNIPIFTAENYEADDVIGTLATQATARSVNTMILTGDTDTLQLVNDHVRVLLANPYAKGNKLHTLYDEAAVIERYKGLKPGQLADLRGLKGDTSDNIPGVKGIGEAGAIALLNQFGTVETLYDQLADAPNRYKKVLDGQRESAVFSKKLATIVCDAPVTLDLEAARLHDYNQQHVIKLFQELEIGASLVKRLPPTGSGLEVVALPVNLPSSPSQLDMFAPPSNGTPTQLGMFGDATSAVPPPPVLVAHGTYRTCQTPADLADLVAELAAAPAFGFDTETNQLQAVSADLTGLSVAMTPGTGWYVPLGHREGQQLPLANVREALQPFFADPNKPKYAHNAKFDLEVLANAGFVVEGVTFDTMLAATLLPNKRKGLKELAFYELKLEQPMTEIETLIGKKGKDQQSFATVPIDLATPYAAADADMTLRLVQALEPQLKTHGQTAEIFYQLEMPLLPVLVRMERAGITLDAPFMRELGARLGKRVIEIEEQIYQVAGKEFNINSGEQLSEVLFGKLGLDSKGLEKTKTGRISLTADVLDGLRERDLNNTGIIDLILQQRQLSKLKSTYIDALPSLVNPQTGRVHTTYSQLGAATGRLSSNDPNLQNIPTRTDEGREIRRGFIAAPGCQFIAADYSQIELRVLAHITNDPNLVRAFQENQDIHAATAAQLFNIPLQDVDKNQRRLAKTTVFGIVYGISAFGLAQRTNLSRTEAQALIDGFFARFPTVRTYIDQTIEAGTRDGFVQSLFGRRRYMYELRSGPPARQKAAQREAINAPIQATAADIMKIAMIRVDAALRRERLHTKMLLQVHDELIFEAPIEERATAAALVQHEMEHAFELRVPLSVEVEQGPNWLEMS